MRHGLQNHHRKRVLQRGVGKGICRLVGGRDIAELPQKKHPIGNAQALGHGLEMGPLQAAANHGQDYLF